MNLNELLEKFNIKPKDISIYYSAFTHKSFANEKRLKTDYQRLEFLGDSVLDMIVSEYLFGITPHIKEGRMTIMRASTVNANRLASFAKELCLDEYIRFGNSQKDFKDNLNILADVFEAFVAAIYIDQGIEKVKEVIGDIIFGYLKSLKEKQVKNPKTILQEYLQLESRGTIAYNTVKKGEQFISHITHDGTKFEPAKGSTKKEAEVNAAINALKLLGKKISNEIN